MGRGEEALVLSDTCVGLVDALRTMTVLASGCSKRDANCAAVESSNQDQLAKSAVTSRGQHSVTSSTL